MFRRTLLLDRLLGDLAGTEPMTDYCRTRGIGLAPHPGDGADEAVRRWQSALSRLSPERQADVELELAQVNDLATRDSVYHLIDVGGGKGAPCDLIPGEAAQALWFLVHQPDVFQEVFFHEEVLEAESWQNALAPPGVPVTDVKAGQARLERGLAAFFRASEGTGRFCRSHHHHFRDPDCHVVIAYVSDRLRLLDAFSEDGEHRRERLRPASQVTFAYYPGDGALLLRTRCRSRQKVLSLLHLFCDAVLGCAFDEESLSACYDLDRLKSPFAPPLPEGVLAARVKALELAYPASEGRRRVRLETNAADSPSAIPQLLRGHVSDRDLPRLRVASAELQVVVGVRGRPRSLFVRLWPGRSSLNQTPTADLLRRCLRVWGLSRHATRP